MGRNVQMYQKYGYNGFHFCNECRYMQSRKDKSQYCEKAAMEFPDEELVWKPTYTACKLFMGKAESGQEDQAVKETEPQGGSNDGVNSETAESSVDETTNNSIFEIVASSIRQQAQAEAEEVKARNQRLEDLRRVKETNEGKPKRRRSKKNIPGQLSLMDFMEPLEASG